MLKEKISQNLNSALKEKRELEVSVLRQLLAAVFNKEKEKRYKLSKEKPNLDLEKLGKESPQIKELKKLIREAMTKGGAKEMRDMGKVMAELMPKIKGQADTGQISQNVKDLLS